MDKIPWRKMIVAGAYVAGGWLVRHGLISHAFVHYAAAALSAAVAWMVHNPPPPDLLAKLESMAAKLEELEKKLSTVVPAQPPNPT